MNGRRRVGLYGGTFDPVHNGHLYVARELLRNFALDQIVFIPAFAAPHKRDQAITPAIQRYAMLALATRRDNEFVVSTVEMDAPARPYTIETLTALMQLEGPEVRLFFILGADSWMEIDSWREFERVLGLTDHIVVTRPDSPLGARHVGSAIRDRIVDVRGFDRRSITRRLDHDPGPSIFFTDVAFVDTSATAIRSLVGAGREMEWKTQVPAEVGDYIKKYELYK
ncbi:MAG: nicotinate-nucleotide adenylyltransferase [Pyrinomonadaceae bacterium]